MLSSLPRALVARYAPPLLKRLARSVWRRLRRPAPPRHLFVFGGRTEYWPGAGRALFAREPAFRAAIQECERITTQELGGPSIIQQFEGEADPAFFSDERRLMHTSAVMQLALVDLWRANGVEPEAVLGVSLGEIAAVYAAGGLSLTDALRVSACYYTISEVETFDYAVLVVGAGFEACARLVASGPAGMFIVLVLDAGSCFVFCARAQVAAAQAYLAAHDTSCTLLNTEPMLPYHAIGLARHVERLRPPLRGLQPRPTTRPAYLSTLGRLVPAGTVLGADYWLALCQYPVNVHGALSAALADGYELLTPIGADPFPYFQGQPQARLGRARLLTSLHPHADERALFESMREELQKLRPKRPLTPEAAVSAADFARQLDLMAPDMLAEPYPSFAFLRQHGPVHFLPREQGWLVVDGELVNEVLRQPELYSSKALADFDTELIGADPPLHTSNRSLFQPFFSPRELATLSDYATATVEELAHGLRERHSFDFVTEFAIPLTQAVGGQLLGLTRAEREKLQRSLPGHAYSMSYLPELTRFFEDYFQEPHEPANPPVMLDGLQAHLQAGLLTLSATVNLTKTMWLAGIATSSMLMISAARYLLTHPATAEQLRAQPELVEAFVEEILRLESPLILFWRRTTECVTLGGVELPANTSVISCIGAANRDPARYPHPDELDLSRRPTRHHAFGGGIHACLGAHLARLEARIVVRWLLAQGPALRLANPFALPQYFPTHHFRALATLPLAFTSPTAA